MKATLLQAAIFAIEALIIDEIESEPGAREGAAVAADPGRFVRAATLCGLADKLRKMAITRVAQYQHDGAGLGLGVGGGITLNDAMAQPDYIAMGDHPADYGMVDNPDLAPQPEGQVFERLQPPNVNLGAFLRGGMLNQPGGVSDLMRILGDYIEKTGAPKAPPAESLLPPADQLQYRLHGLLQSREGLAKIGTVEAQAVRLNVIDNQIDLLIEEIDALNRKDLDS